MYKITVELGYQTPHRIRKYQLIRGDLMRHTIVDIGTCLHHINLSPSTYGPKHAFVCGQAGSQDIDGRKQRTFLHLPHCLAQPASTSS